MKRNLLIPCIIFTLVLSGCGNISNESTETPSEIKSVISSELQIAEPNKGTESQQEVLEDTKVAPNTVVSSKDYYIENNWNKKVVNTQLADLTHDGVDDYVVTIIYVDSSVTTQDPSEMLDNAGVGYIQVYDGSDTDGLDALGTLLWEKEFASAHAGNAQVNLVHREGLDYLMPTDIYSMMGTYYFHYEVLYLDAKGNKHIVEEQSLNYDTIVDGEQKPLSVEQKQEIADFKEKLEAWFEGATLLVATDVALKEQLVSTPDKQYVPEDYYDVVLKEYE